MGNIFDIVFGRSKHVCPWWCCFTFDNPFRKLFQNPEKILSPYVKNGYTVMDIGPGMGYFTISLCRLVGKEGKVIAIDIQDKMLKALYNRAAKAGVNHNLTTHLSQPDDLGIHDRADFILAFWMLHEVPDQTQLLKNIKRVMKSDAKLLIAEPFVHVTTSMFESSLEKAQQLGFVIEDRPKISFSNSALLVNR